MKRRFLLLLLLFLLTLNGCSGGDNGVHSNKNNETISNALTDEQAVANAKKLNEEYNLTMDSVFNLKYTATEVETDGYNRYIVRLVYEYENKNRQLNKSDTLFYYTYAPDTEQISFSRICFWATDNFGISNQNGWDYIKSLENFGWGQDPDTRIEAEDRPQYGNSAENNFNPEENNTSDVDSYVSTAYEQVFNGMAEPIGYAVFDMDSDGIDELIVKGGTCEADYTFMFFSYVDGNFMPLGDAGAGHSVLVSDGETGVIIFGAQMGYEWADRVTINNDELNFEPLYEKDVGDNPYTEWDIYVEMFDITF